MNLELFKTAILEDKIDSFVAVWARLRNFAHNDFMQEAQDYLLQLDPNQMVENVTKIARAINMIAGNDHDIQLSLRSGLNIQDGQEDLLSVCMISESGNIWSCRNLLTQSVISMRKGAAGDWEDVQVNYYPREAVIARFKEDISNYRLNGQPIDMEALDYLTNLDLSNVRSENTAQPRMFVTK